MAEKKTQKSQNEIRESMHKVWLAGLGAIATAEEEGKELLGKLEVESRELFGKLVEKGEAFESRNRERFDKSVESARGEAEKRWHQVGEEIDERVSATMERLGVPTRDEIRNLTRRVEELNEKIEPLVDEKSSGKTRKAKAGTSAKTAKTAKTATA